MPLLVVVLGLTLFFAGFMAYMARRQAVDRFALFKNSLNSLSSSAGGTGFLANEAPQFAEIWRETQERITRSQLELAEARAQAEVVSVAAQVAHDIRSPLSALSVVSKSLQKTASPDQLSLLTSAVTRIEGIADDLLKRKNIKSGFLPSLGVLKIHGCSCSDLVSLLKNILTEKSTSGRKVELSSESSFSGTINLDYVLFGRVLSNLIQNALEAAPTGAVTVKILSNSSHVQIDVIDTGKGIPPEVLAKLGKMPLSYDKVGGGSGNGLGVYHATEAMRAMGGSLAIDSTVGRGTTMSLQFPFA